MRSALQAMAVRETSPMDMPWKISVRRPTIAR